MSKAKLGLSSLEEIMLITNGKRRVVRVGVSSEGQEKSVLSTVGKIQKSYLSKKRYSLSKAREVFKNGQDQEIVDAFVYREKVSAEKEIPVVSPAAVYNDYTIVA